jgi:protoporphyrin/coproporphyrin ferrochelatase
MTKKALLLMNLGSPDSTRVKDVRRYLNEFLMDERVIDIPYLPRLMLVKGIIAPFRAPKSAEAYKSIWTKDGSPLITISKDLTKEVQAELPDMPVRLCMRYGNPSPQVAFDALAKEFPDLEEVVLLPLYPHYAMSSYETAVEYAREIHAKNNYPFRLSMIGAFYNDTDYLDALAESLRPYIQPDLDLILFSYHGIPERHVKKTDPTRNTCLMTADCCSRPNAAHATCYRHQVFFTTAEIAARLNLPKEKVATSFQSRLGRDPWLKPYTAVRLKELPAEGIKNILVVCPAFVSDCLETLEEMGEEGKEFFLEAGGTKFTLAPCMNVHPAWVHTIGEWMRDYEKGESKLIAMEKTQF